MRISAAFLSILLQTVSYSDVLAHSGSLNTQGCHNNAIIGYYHCHLNSSSSQKIKQEDPGMTEDYFNLQLAQQLGGRNETIHQYLFGLEGQSKNTGLIKVDVETENFVIEGGKDTRDSLDSVQQAVFASVVSGKKPAVAIYDTDGIWGKYEHRIWTVSKALNIKFIWFHKGTVIEINEKG